MYRWFLLVPFLVVSPFAESRKVAAQSYPVSRPVQNKMVLMSVLNNTLVNMTNAERRGKRQVIIRPSSKVVVKFLQVMQKHGTSQE
jgi:hypothetical protein